MTRAEKAFSQVFLLLPLLVVARLTLLVRPRLDYSTVDANAALQIGIVATVFLTMLIAPKLSSVLTQLSRSSVGMLLLYFMLCIISALWSSNPTYTAYRAAEALLLSSAVFFSLCYVTDIRNLEYRVLLAAGLVVLFGVGMHVKLGGISIESLHTNSYSAVAGMMLVYCTSEYLFGPKADGRRRRRLLRFGTFAMFFLIVGTSAASNISVVFGLLVLGVFARNRLLLMLVALSISIGLVILPPDSILKVLAPGKSETAIETLSGRSWLWGLYIDEVMKSPWLGHGFAASTRTLSFYSVNTHNGLLAVVLGTGVIGLTVFAIFLLRVGREALALLRGTARQGFGASIAVATGLLNNMSISLLGEHWVPATMGIVLFLVLQFRFVQFQTHKRPDDAAVLSHQCDARQ